MNLKKIFLASLIALSNLGMVACAANTSTDPASTLKAIYVMPTEYGKQCISGKKEDMKKMALRNGISIKKAKEETESYYMTVYTGTIPYSAGLKFHDQTTGGYSDNDIDVALFGIGTNFNNSSDADTVLYASTTEDSSNVSNDNTKTLVTGVEYAYGTGPIANEFDKPQNVWLKTTVMEHNEDGYYEESDDYKTTYTCVYVTLKDSIAPVLYQTEYTLPQRLLVDNQSNLENVLKDKNGQLVEMILSNANQAKFCQLDKDETHDGIYVKSIDFGSTNFSNISVTDTLSFTVILADGDGNISDTISCTLTFTGDGLLLPENLGELSYTTSSSQLKLLLGLINTPYDVSIISDDSVFYDLNKGNLQSVLNKEQTVQYKLLYKGYEMYFNGTSTFEVKYTLIDDIGPKVKMDMRLLKDATSESDIISIVLANSKITDDFEDEYTYKVYSMLSEDDLWITVRLAVYDSKNNEGNCTGAFFIPYDDTGYATSYELFSNYITNSLKFDSDGNIL